MNYNKQTLIHLKNSPLICTILLWQRVPMFAESIHALVTLCSTPKHYIRKQNIKNTKRIQSITGYCSYLGTIC